MSATIADVLENRARWAIVEGDCLDVLPTLADKSVDHVLMDPPFEAQAHTLQRRVKHAESRGSEYGEDDRIAVIDSLSFAPITEDERREVGLRIALVVRRWVAAFCQVEATQKWAAEFESGGLQYIRTGVWVKPDAMPQFTGDRPGMGYESIVFAHPKGRKRWNGGGRVGVFTHNKNSGGAHDHETQKPLSLMLELVSLFTDPDELILDPFAGSGTTGVACLRLGRRFIGIEKDARYAAIARERLQAEDRGLTLRDARAGQTTIFDMLGAK